MNMGYDKVKIRQICLIILYVALILFVLLHIETVVQGFGVVLEILKPFIVGAIIAFILNIPMKGIEERFFGRWNGKRISSFKRPVSLVLSILFLSTVITLVIVAIVPQMKSTFTTLGNKLPGFFADMFVGDVRQRPGLGSALSIVMLALILMVLGITNLIKKYFEKGKK